MDPGEHAGVFFLSNHALGAFEIATTVVSVGETVPSRDDLRDVVFLDDWR